MPIRNVPLVTNQIYHIFNRGTEKRRIFEASNDYKRFLKSLAYYQIVGPKPKFSKFNPNFHKIDSSKKLVELICFCLMPNHFHLLIKQLVDGGITEFISKISNSYTKYYNIKYDRIGYLLQGEFRSVIVDDESYLIHLSRYIHLNPISSFLIKNLENYKWSSYKEYAKNEAGICAKELILNSFSSIDDYQNFVNDQIEYAQSIEMIKHQLIDE